MKVEIKLRRNWQGQDSWGAFLEEVGIGENGHLAYRRSKDGNCEYGTWEPWQSESNALKFMLGPTKVTKTLSTSLVNALKALPTLSDREDPNTLPHNECNYGDY